MSRSPRWPPAGPRLAGRHGIGLLSIGATQAGRVRALALHWNVMEERAARSARRSTEPSGVWSGSCTSPRPASRPTRCRVGIEQWFDYFQNVAAFPQMAVGGRHVREMIDFVNETGLGAIGTPEDAVAQIERLVKQSGGGSAPYC